MLNEDLRVQIMQSAVELAIAYRGEPHYKVVKKKADGANATEVTLDIYRALLAEVTQPPNTGDSES